MAMLIVFISLYLLAGTSESSSSTEYTDQLPHKRQPRATSDSNELSNKVLTWTCPMKYSDRYLSAWYRFLNSLYCKLSEYEIQVAKRNFNVDDIEKWGYAEDAWKDFSEAKERLNTAKPGIKINGYNIQRFLNKIETYNIPGYDSIKNIAITEAQLEELNHVLNLTIKQGIHISCKEPYMFIKGDYVIISQISQYIWTNTIDDSCKGLMFTTRLKFLNIFALNTIFIDADMPIIGMLEPMTVIAPKWRIIGKRMIEFSGKTGESLRSKPSLFHFHGRDGRPGNPGGPGGNFFGIGEEFFNGANLTLSFNGGNGSPGENGENGKNGIDGSTPDIPSSHSGCPSDSCDNNKQINFFHCEQIRCSYTKPAPMSFSRSLTDCEYKIFGKDGTEGGNGGNGGKGGKGGGPGNVELFELNNYSGILQNKNFGQDGLDGYGGTGGIGGKKGDDKIVKCVPKFWRSADWTLVSNMNSNKRAPSGQKGLNGIISKELETPKAADAISNLDKAKIINQYKSYLRENLSDRFKHYFLNTFLKKLENNNKVKSVYETLGFIDELQSLEEHFHKLNEDVNLLPFYQSLLNRINEYAQNRTETVNPSLRKKVLGYLYTATLGKIHNFEDELESSLIIDISSYLESVKNDIEKLKDLLNGKNKEEIINKYKQNYKKEIDTKIKEAIDIISKEITPEIDNIATETDRQIETLVNEVIYLKQQRRAEHEQLTMKQHELENVLILQNVVSSLKIFGSVISFLGPVGNVAGSVIEIGGTVAETFIFNTPGFLNSTAPLTQSVADLESLKGKIQYIRDQKVASLKKSLDSISEETSKHSETFADLSVKVSDFRSRLDKISRNNINSYHFQELQNLEIEVKATLKTKERESVIAQESNADQKTKNEFVAIQNMQKAVQLSSVMLDSYNKHKFNQAKLDTINNAIKKNEHKFYKLKQFEDKIYSTIVPMLQNMQNDIDNMISKLGQKSKVALDVAKWKVKSTLGDIMIQMQQLTKEFTVEPKLTRCIEKMREAIVTLINVHDHVQDFQKDQNFANFIADINSITVSNVHLAYNPKLENDFRYALRDLEIALRSSIVVQRHKVAIDAFKQFVFPFAHTYFKGLILPTHLKLDDNKINITIENLVYKAVTEIDHIKSKLEIYKQTVRKHDGCIGSGEFKSNYNSSKPFFVWNNQDYKSMISKLLSGETVTVKSDVTHSAYNMDAIKFNVIDFKFKSKNQTKQLKIDNAFKQFQITATHLGNSYYRYNNRVYMMMTPSRAIWYYFEKNPHGDPVHRSTSYEKIKTGDFMLSPYACWQIKLDTIGNVSFNQLEVYKDDVDLELGGNGHYINNKRNTDCSDLKVEKYYKSINTYYQRSASFQSNAFSPLLRDEGFASSKPMVNDQNSNFQSNSFSRSLLDEDYVNSNLELSNEELVTFSKIDQKDQDNQESAEPENHNTKSRGSFEGLFSGDGSY